MKHKSFTVNDKEVLQEVVYMLGGTAEAECRSCRNWNRYCFHPPDFVCASHSSISRSTSRCIKKDSA